MSDQEATRARRLRWPVLVLWALAAFGAFSLVQLVLSLTFWLVRLAILAAVIGVVVLFFRGPPDAER